MNWKRIAGFGTLLFVLPELLGFVQGLTLGATWHLYAPTVKEAVAVATLVRRGVLVVFGFGLYLVFLRGIRSRILLHTVTLFASATVAAFLFEFSITGMAPQSIWWSSAAVHLAVAALSASGVAVWRHLAGSIAGLPGYGTHDDSRLHAELTLHVGAGTLWGLVTLGLYWAYSFSVWSRRHAQLMHQILKRQGSSSAVLLTIEQNTRRTQRFSGIFIVLAAVALCVLGLALVWEVILRRGPFPAPEEAVWFLCWVTLSILALVWGSLLLELRTILDLGTGEDFLPDSRPWLLRGPKGKIVLMMLTNIVLALGVLPLLIFPPIAAKTVNGYVAMQQRRHREDAAQPRVAGDAPTAARP